jgi:hypothetical protein
MVFSELLIKIPYKIMSFISNKILKRISIYFYADNSMDYEIFRNIHKHIPNVKIVVKNKTVQNELLAKNVISDVYPVFPSLLLMARHSLHKFPDKNLITIGMSHGAYHFKEFIGAEKYNRFDMFILTSETEVRQAESIGIKCGVSGGFPKIDNLFSKESIEKAKQFRKTQFKNDKPVILFTATWEKSGLSAIDKWYNNLNCLTRNYNVMVTLHPWISEEKKNIIKAKKDVFFIEEYDLTKYLLAADVMVADTSSVIAEFTALDKPVITFKVEKQGRLPQEIINMLDEMTYRIVQFSELKNALLNATKNPNELSSSRAKYNKIMIQQPFGNHGLLAANKIREFLDTKGITV